MTSLVVTFLASLTVAATLTPLIVRWARARGFYDAPGERKIHARPVPRLGGVAIAVAFFVPVSLLLVLDTGMTQALVDERSHVLGLYVGGLLIAALGLYDDLKGANAGQKFLVQIGVAVLMYALDYRIEVISNPFGGPLELGVFAPLVTVLWFVGVINAVNLIDGLDGLAGGVAFIAVVTLLALGLMDGHTLAALFCASLAGALLGFLFFNFNPARIFMGDTGALFLGFVLACFSITTSSKSSTTVAIIVPTLALGLPITDTVLAFTRRLRRGRSPFSSDRLHIHHRLLASGLSHRQAVLALYGIAAVLGVSAIMIRASTGLVSALTLVSLALCLCVFLKLLAARTDGSPAQEIVQELHPVVPRPELRRLVAAIRDAEDSAAAGDALIALARASSAATVALEDAANERTTWYFHWADEAVTTLPDKDFRACRIPLEHDDDTLACLFVSYVHHPGRAAVDMSVPWELAGHALTERWETLSWSREIRAVPTREVHKAKRSAGATQRDLVAGA